jgi:hypothetical protein
MFIDIVLHLIIGGPIVWLLIYCWFRLITSGSGD